MKIDTRQFDKLVDQMQKIAPTTVKKAGKFFKTKTPVDTGNARRRTRTDVGNRTIKADYGYAGRLDEGWSKQAPAGMSDPTVKYIEDLISEQVGKL